MTSLSRDQIIDYIGGLTVFELPDFIDALKDRLKIKDVPMVVAGGMPAAISTDDKGGSSAKSEFELYLKDAGANKVAIIRIVRSCIPALTLIEAKNQIDAIADPMLLKKGSKDEVDKLKADLETAGATVEIK